ncbi:alkyl hydroperoxide reductase [Niabella ginsenosidivorans]|uniref:Alkyl hydroperoxide reductase n=1 Tax=Niabella ginsenosidivorans TaxID=1176587 RepID=A0A1A9I4P5_9BACT|nr:TlpA disulfide reductase family protein [Niabella ginsenosidivorans]ANH82648.1 alkyl hydroperoxide reductase [Niabella ginsenosidivorans]
MKLKPRSGIVFLALLLTAACTNKAKEPKPAETATAAADTNMQPAPPPALTEAPSGVMPSFKMVDEKGQFVPLESLKGKKVFVNIWASWCPPCRAEMPSIQNLRKKLGDDKVTFVLLSVDNSFEEATEFKKAHGLKLPIFYPGEQLPVLFNVQAIPSTFIFDEKGTLIRKMEGMENYDTQEYRDLLKG